MTELSEFLTRALNERGWSMRKFGRAAKVSHSLISEVISGNARPSADFVVSAAHALDADPVRLLRLAGILPDVPAFTEQQEALCRMVSQIDSPTDYDAAFRMIAGLAQSTGPLPVSARPTTYHPPPRCPDCVFNENFTQAQRTAALRKMLDLYGEEYIPVFLRFITESLEDQRREEEKRPTERPQPGNDQPGRAEGNGTTTTENSAAPTGAVRSSN
jgi:transcriptional regulator with XRE-family HTH domain